MTAIKGKSNIKVWIHQINITFWKIFIFLSIFFVYFFDYFQLHATVWVFQTVHSFLHHNGKCKKDVTATKGKSNLNVFTRIHKKLLTTILYSGKSLNFWTFCFLLFSLYYSFYLHAFVGDATNGEYGRKDNCNINLFFFFFKKIFACSSVSVHDSC